MPSAELADTGLEPALPIAPQLFRNLRRRIVHNDLPAGHRISETDIAMQYGVSRQPVREAFIKLAGEDLLEILPQRGTFVRKIRYVAVLDARFLREAIEADIVRILARSPQGALIAALREQIEAQRRAAEREQEAFFALDDRFHRTLAAAAGLEGAWRQIEGLKSQMDRVRYLALAQFPVDNLIGQHATLVDRIEAGDVGAAEAAIRRHLREILEDLPRIVSAVPDFFDLPDGELPRPVNTPTDGGENA